jgi:hypothetical protein
MPDAVPALDQECFFIAPIGPEDSSVRKRSDGVLDFIVSKAAEELGLTALRGDQIGEPGQITLQVIDHILGARAAVADLTGLNPNVFYELAVRHTARLPVALIAEVGSDLPFDIAQMRTILFDHRDLRSADLCRQAIVTHLKEALNGAVDSPIATSVDVRALQTGSAVERNIAELVTTVDEMSQLQRRTAQMLTGISDEIARPSRRSRRDRQAMLDAIKSLERLAAIVGRRGGGEPANELIQMEQAIRFLRNTILMESSDSVWYAWQNSEALEVTPDSTDFVENSTPSAGDETPIGPNRGLRN